MAAGLAFGLIRERPALTIFPQSKHFASLAQRLPGQIIQGIHFVRALGDHTKTSRPQFAGQSLEVLDLEFDLDFERRGHFKEQYKRKLWLLQKCARPILISQQVLGNSEFYA